MFESISLTAKCKLLFGLALYMYLGGCRRRKAHTIPQRDCIEFARSLTKIYMKIVLYHILFVTGSRHTDFVYEIKQNHVAIVILGPSGNAWNRSEWIRTQSIGCERICTYRGFIQYYFLCFYIRIIIYGYILRSSTTALLYTVLRTHPLKHTHTKHPSNYVYAISLSKHHCQWGLMQMKLTGIVHWV